MVKIIKGLNPIRSVLNLVELWVGLLDNKWFNLSRIDGFEMIELIFEFDDGF